MNRACRLTLMIAASAGLAGLRAAPAQALPPDPQRAFEAQSCAEAQIRYREAVRGSPLISPAEATTALRRAALQLARLCERPRPDQEKTQNRPNDLQKDNASENQMS